LQAYRRVRKRIATQLLIPFVGEARVDEQFLGGFLSEWMKHAGVAPLGSLMDGFVHQIVEQVLSIRTNLFAKSGGFALPNMQELEATLRDVERQIEIRE